MRVFTHPVRGTKVSGTVDLVSTSGSSVGFMSFDDDSRAAALARGLFYQWHVEWPCWMVLLVVSVFPSVAEMGKKAYAWTLYPRGTNKRRILVPSKD